LNSNENIQDNIARVNQSSTTKQLEMLNNSNIVIHKKPVEMNVNEVRNGSEASTSTGFFRGGGGDGFGGSSITEKTLFVAREKCSTCIPFRYFNL